MVCPICQRRRPMGICPCGYDLLTGDASRVSARARRDLYAARALFALGATLGGLAMTLGLIFGTGPYIGVPVTLMFVAIVRGARVTRHAGGRLAAASGGMLPAARVIHPGNT